MLILTGLKKWIMKLWHCQQRDGWLSGKKKKRIKIKNKICMQTEFFHHRSANVYACVPQCRDRVFLFALLCKTERCSLEVALQFGSLWSLSRCSYFMYFLEQIISEHLRYLQLLGQPERAEYVFSVTESNASRAKSILFSKKPFQQELSKRF